jgi:hypothetical protein
LCRWFDSAPGHQEYLATSKTYTLLPVGLFCFTQHVPLPCNHCVTLRRDTHWQNKPASRSRNRPPASYTAKASVQTISSIQLIPGFRDNFKTLVQPAGCCATCSMRSGVMCWPVRSCTQTTLRFQSRHREMEKPKRLACGATGAMTGQAAIRHRRPCALAVRPTARTSLP